MSALTWRKARSCHANGACVEIAKSGRTFMVRDSKDLTSPLLSFGGTEWRRFMTAVRSR